MATTVTVLISFVLGIFLATKVSQLLGVLGLGKILDIGRSWEISNSYSEWLRKLLDFGRLRKSSWDDCSDFDGLPDGIIRLNDSVFQLYSPPEPEISMEIIFFHGFLNYKSAMWKTWLAQDSDDLVWPKEWLSRMLPNARILSISYDSCLLKKPARNDSDTLGQNLVFDIILDHRLNIGQGRKVFLVGHGSGEVILKQFIISAVERKQVLNDRNTYERGEIKRISEFIKNFKGVFSYSGIVCIADRFLPKSPFCKLMRFLDKTVARIDERFGNVLIKSNVEAFYAGAGNVFRGSRFFAKNYHYPVSFRRRTLKINGADYFTVCRAKSCHPDDEVIRFLKARIVYL
ncbi:unnamed protein product [Calypogeia fissa]